VPFVILVEILRRMLIERSVEVGGSCEEEKAILSQAQVAHACNLSYLGDRAPGK
jgi:hypothetical protein